MTLFPLPVPLPLPLRAKNKYSYAAAVAPDVELLDTVGDTDKLRRGGFFGGVGCGEVERGRIISDRCGESLIVDLQIS